MTVSSKERNMQEANFSPAWSHYLLPPDGILRLGRIEEVHFTGGGKKRLGAHFCFAK